jgi:hypothetical protein
LRLTQMHVGEGDAALGETVEGGTLIGERRDVVK